MTPAYAILRMNGREFVLVPKAEFQRMTEQDRRDARVVAKAATRYRAGKSNAVPLVVVKRELGLS
jgi:PHD/YefM family antitoxin component YafN of YafNO toxin-antitoxin module